MSPYIMFANSKNLIWVILILLSIVVVPIRVDAKHLIASNGACDGEVCTFTLSSQGALSKQLCNNASTLVWNRVRPRYYIVQCDCNCTMQTNTIWLVDNKGGTVSGFLGRVVSTKFVEDADAQTRIPDRFTEVRFCKRPQRDMVSKSIFVILHKRPDEKNGPYCYEAVYILPENVGVTIFGDTGVIARDDSNYRVHTVSRWQRSVLLSIGKSLN